MTTAPSHRPQVLIVDDDAITRRILVNVLEGVCDTYQADSGQRALEIARSQERPSLIILDLVMPDMSGFVVCTELMQAPETRDIPVIFLTSLDDAKSEEQGLAIGAVDFLLKPVKPSIVRARVRTHLELRQHRAFLEKMIERRDEDLKASHERVSELLIAQRISEQRFRAFMNHAPLAMSLKDCEGRYLMASAVTTKHAGLREHEMLGRTNEELGRWQGLTTCAEIAAQERAVCENEMAVTMERIETAHGGNTTVLSSTTFPVRDAKARVVGVGTVSTDITQRRRAEQAMHESEARLSAFFNHAPHPYAIKDHEGRYLKVNPAMCKFFGLPMQDLAGKTVHDFQPAELAELVVDADRRALDSGEIIDQETVWPTAQGKRFMHVVKFPIRDAGAEIAGVGTILTDIDEQKRAQRALEHQQQELRRLASEVSLAEERERRRIAAELHDGAVQNLGLIRIKVGVLCSRLADSEHAGALEDLRELLDRSIREVRSLTSEISPPLLYEMGLVPALEWLAERFQETHVLRCTMQRDNRVRPLPTDVAVLLFQGVRELLTNVAKHASARHASISVRQDDDYLELVVCDDGVGIDGARLTLSPSDSGGFGLFNIRERLRLLGGEMRIQAADGTKVTLQVPVSDV